jgi:long-chain acyl-CoA synthetase
MQLVSEIFAAAARHYPGRIFVDDGARRLTYREFEDQVCRLANVLDARGVKAGDPVGIYLPNTIELVLGYHACQRVGAIAAPLSAMYTQRELAEVAQRTQMAVLVTGAQGRGTAVSAGEAVETLTTILDFGGGSGDTIDACAEMESASGEFDVVRRDPEDIAALFFSSGTTGAPKGIKQSHRGIYSTVRDMEVYNRFRCGQEVLLSVLPMFNNFGATCVGVQAVLNAGTLIIHERWDTLRVLRDIGRHHVTYFAGTPTMLTYMTQEYRPGEHDLTSLRLAVTGGAPVTPELITACEKDLGVQVRQIYGSTEVCGYVAGDPVVGVRKRSSTGPAFGSASIVVCDDDGNEVPTGTVGEVIISGDTVASGYWCDEQATGLAFSEKGWHSGDLGYVDEDGYVFIVDRKKDLIICGGFNIYPKELEGVLFTHPEVRMAAVVGVPDAVRGEVPVAFIVPMNSPAADLADELLGLCRQQLAAYKIPRRIVFMDEMPTGPSGKILKRELRLLETTAS